MRNVFRGLYVTYEPPPTVACSRSGLRFVPLDVCLRVCLSLRKCGLLANVSTCGAASGHPQLLILIPLPTTTSSRMSSRALWMNPFENHSHLTPSAKISFVRRCPIVLRTSRTRLGSQTSQHGTTGSERVRETMKRVRTSKQTWTCVDMMSLERK
ncbi:hypothetical protein EDB84DRAFT_1522322, partial [Lactarius hengduanensis]